MGGQLFKQYPFICTFTKYVVGGCAKKVVLFKNIYKVQNGRHSLKERYEKYYSYTFNRFMLYKKDNDTELQYKSFKVPIHHFKWNKNVVKYLEERGTRYKRKNRTQWNQSYRAAKWLQRNSGNINLLNVTNFNCSLSL